MFFFRFADEAQGRSAAANMDVLQTMLEALPPAIPQLRSLSCGKDLSRSPASFDFGLATTFDSLDDLEIYRVHPEHQKVVALIKDVTTERAVVDYESS